MACFHPRGFPLQVVKRVPSAFDSVDWLSEIKHDGFRVLAIREGAPPVCIPETAMTSAVAISTSRRHWQPFRPGDLSSTASWSCSMRVAIRISQSWPAAEPVRIMPSTCSCSETPTCARRSLICARPILADLLHGCGEPVRYCDHVIGVGKEFFEIVRDAGLEGVVAKRRSSAYAGVLNDDWLKIKCLRVHDFVVGGWISDADKKIGALLLGEFIDGNLRYVGQVGSPSGWRVMRAVTRLLSSYLLNLAKLV